MMQFATGLLVVAITTEAINLESESEMGFGGFGNGAFGHGAPSGFGGFP